MRGGGSNFLSLAFEMQKNLVQSCSRALQVANRVSNCVSLLLKCCLVGVVPLVAPCLPRGEQLDERGVCASALGDCRAQVGLVFVIVSMHCLRAGRGGNGYSRWSSMRLV